MRSRVRPSLAAGLVAAWLVTVPAAPVATAVEPSLVAAATEDTTEDATGEAPAAPPGTGAVALGLAPGERPTLPPNVGGWPAPPAVTAASLLLVDVDADTVLAARAPDRLRSVASTVKMLTAITARRVEPDLDRVVRAGPEVRELEGSGVGLREGEAWTVRDLLEGMLVRSGNDAAATMAAQLVPGGTDAFLAEMAADAARLGLDGAVIVSPSGLDDRNQFSAAHLAIIAAELLADPVLAEIVDLEAVRLPGIGALPNRNVLVREDPTAIGVKTGFTEAAGSSLVAAVERDGRTLIAVLLASATLDARFEDARRLFEFAADFESLPVLTPVELGCAGGTTRLLPAATSVVVPRATADLVAVPWPPARCPTEDFVVTPTLQRLPLSPVEVDVEVDGTALAADGDAALGLWLADTVQRALRMVPDEVVPGRAVPGDPDDGV